MNYDIKSNNYDVCQNYDILDPNWQKFEKLKLLQKTVEIKCQIWQKVKIMREKVVIMMFFYLS